LVERLQRRLSNGNRINWRVAILDATIVPAKRGAPESAPALSTGVGRPARSTSSVTAAASR
jgi:hypothetical protein